MPGNWSKSVCILFCGVPVPQEGKNRVFMSRQVKEAVSI